jgi:NitT/TauT family transport system permease protein/putative hydroxymethylpyrimidine transport system permease protein
MSVRHLRGARRALPAIVLVALLLGVWELYADTRSAMQAVFVPSVHAQVAALFDNAGLIASNLATTAKEVGLGLCLALAFGLASAVAIHFSRFAREAAYPLLVGSQAIPIAVLAPLLVFWWGFGVLPKLFVIVLICFFPIVVTTVDGLAAVDPDQLKLLRTLGASRWQAFRFAEWPAALPAALSGARIAVAVAVIGAVIAEISTPGTASGLGHEIQVDLNYATAQSSSRAWAATAVLFVFALACFYAFGLVQRRIAPWTAVKRPAGT